MAWHAMLAHQRKTCSRSTRLENSTRGDQIRKTYMWRKYLTNWSRNGLSNTKPLSESCTTSRIKSLQLTLTSCGLPSGRQALMNLLMPNMSATYQRDVLPGGTDLPPMGTAMARPGDANIKRGYETYSRAAAEMVRRRCRGRPRTSRRAKDEPAARPR